MKSNFIYQFLFYTHNTLFMEEPVKVYIRVRPPSEFELSSKDYKKCTEVPSAQTFNLIYPRDTVRPFHYDGVLNDSSAESEVYDLSAKRLVDHVLQGYNGTFFVYGQTGTGKTHTMGLLKKISQKSQGIIPLSLKQIFSSDKPLNVTLSFLQIYMENVYDLLKPDKKPLKVREDPTGGIFVSDLTQVPTENFSQAANLINAGVCNRIMGSHNANQTSSRSHIVLALDVEQGNMTSRLTLIDLAGSERVGSTSSSGLRLDEAKFINSSLSALGKVVSALSTENLTHIPFRDSKLTRLLQPSLNGKVVLVATVSPCYKYGGETLSTLQFASRCKQVICMPTIEEDLSIGPVDNKSFIELKRREEFLSARVKELETQNSLIFNHSHSEVIYYLLRLLAKLTQNSIKITQEVDKIRNLIDPTDLRTAEEKFPYPLLGYRQENDEEYMKELFVKLDMLPSAQVVEKVQFLAKKLVDNLNSLGKISVQAQYMKGTYLGKLSNNEYFETLKREASEVVLHPKQKSIPTAPTKPQLLKITDLSQEKQEKMQKNLSLKELLQSKKNNTSFEMLESRVLETDPSLGISFTTRETVKEETKRTVSKSPLPQRRATLSRRPDTQPDKREKSDFLTRVGTKIKINNLENRIKKSVSPLAKKPDYSIKAKEKQVGAGKDDFLAELEKELASINGEEWFDTEI